MIRRLIGLIQDIRDKKEQSNLQGFHMGLILMLDGLTVGQQAIMSIIALVKQNPQVIGILM